MHLNLQKWYFESGQLLYAMKIIRLKNN